MGNIVRVACARLSSSFIDGVTTMDFRPSETLFFCDNFSTLGLIGLNFRHEPFQLKRQFLSIWFVNEKSKFGVLVVVP